MRVGMGFDIHRLVPERPLILGGVKIPHSKGLQGHSDADVLLHALCDALLGALGAGDIGTYFPESDPQWKNAESRLFVEKACELMRQKSFHIENVDLVLLTEEPRLSPFRGKIVQSIAHILEISTDQVNVKAKTMEGLGPIGQQEAMAAYATVLIQ